MSEWEDRLDVTTELSSPPTRGRQGDLLHPARRSSVTRFEPSADGTIGVVGAAAAGEWHIAGVHTVA